MANHKSAIKRARQDIIRNVRNSSRKTKIKSSVKKLNELISNKDKAASEETLKKVSAVILKAASKGTLHNKTASRKISRLSKKISALG